MIHVFSKIDFICFQVKVLDSSGGAMDACSFSVKGILSDKHISFSQT
jgi:hypothetical protein